ASGAGLAEVNISRLAAERAAATEVKGFAQHMIEDHSKANAELLKLADSRKLRPAERMDAEHQKTFDRLAGLKGDSFDRGYGRGDAQGPPGGGGLVRRRLQGPRRKGPAGLGQQAPAPPEAPPRNGLQAARRRGPEGQAEGQGPLSDGEAEPGGPASAGPGLVE